MKKSSYLDLGLSLSFFLLLFGQLRAQSPSTPNDPEEEPKVGIEAITDEQTENLKANLDALVAATALAIDKRHAEAFARYEEVKDNNLSLYNFHIESYVIVRFSDEQEDNADEFRAWRRNFDEQADTQDFTNMLRAQMQWLALLKRAELARRKATNNSNPWGQEAQLAELELMPEAIALLEQIVANAESYGKHFLDLRGSAFSTPIARAYGFQNYSPLRPRILSQAPLQFENMYRNGLIMPAIRSKNTFALEEGWRRLMAMQREVLRLKFEIRKKEAVERERKNRTNRDNQSRRDESRLGNFEDSPELATFTNSILPSMMWRREIDRFNMGDEVQASANMMRLLEEYPEHPRYNNWFKSIRSLLAKSDQRRKQQQGQARE